MVRGLERRAIFWGDADRDEVETRRAVLADAGTLTVYAWALWPNRAHRLVRTGNRPLAPVLGVRPQNVDRSAAGRPGWASMAQPDGPESRPGSGRTLDKWQG
jgi:hypothetical protein